MATLWWLNRHYTVDDDFMKRAKYWLNCAILVRTSLCFLKCFWYLLPLDDFIAKLEAANSLWAAVLFVLYFNVP